MHVDSNVNTILKQDGIRFINSHEPNQALASVPALIERYGRDTSWSHCVVNTPCNSATLIAQLPGEGNRPHFHQDWDEWWYIIEGEWLWLLDDQSLRVCAGDIVFAERNRKHHMLATGDQMAIRLAVSRYDIDHCYR